MNFLFKLPSESPTQQLIKEVDNLLPGLCSFFSGKFRKVGSSVVHVQAVNALQHDSDHSLRTETRGPERSRIIIVLLVLVTAFCIRIRCKAELRVEVRHVLSGFTGSG